MHTPKGLGGSYCLHSNSEKRTTMSFTAWGDESVRITAEEPMYLTGACILDDDALSAIEAIEKLAPKGAKKTHWRDMGVRAQKKALSIISQMAHTTCIVVAAPIKPGNQERARRKCLEKLILRLEALSVETLVLESRDSFLDKKDIDFLLYLRRCGLATKIDVQHRKGSDEPYLCIPDQLLGAYGELVVAKDSQPAWLKEWDAIKGSIETIPIAL